MFDLVARSGLSRSGWSICQAVRCMSMCWRCRSPKRDVMRIRVEKQVSTQWLFVPNPERKAQCFASGRTCTRPAFARSARRHCRRWKKTGSCVCAYSSRCSTTPNRVARSRRGVRRLPDRSRKHRHCLRRAQRHLGRRREFQESSRNRTARSARQCGWSWPAPLAVRV